MAYGVHMGKYTIWVRVEDEPKWLALENRPEWIHKQLEATK